MKTNLISKSESADILRSVSDKWKIELSKNKNLKVHYLDNDAQIIIGNGFKILKIMNEYFPFLSETSLLEKFPNVMVDMGAVKFMCNGANVMRPGIRNYTEFKKNEIVCVIEESKHKFLAVGIAILDSSELDGMSKVEVIKNIHYISDKYWEAGKII